ncbi:MAG: ABC-2 transporter permease [Sarcina sp.]
MNSILNLVKKEIHTFIICKHNLIILALCIFYAIAMPRFITLGIVLIMYCFALGPFLEDDRFKHGFLNYALPIKKSHIIIARYILVLISAFLGFALILLSLVFQNSIDTQFFFIFSTIILFISTISTSIAIPFVVKFCGKNIRLISIFLICISTFASGFFASNNIDIFTIINNFKIIYLIVFLISIFTFFVSMLISIKINKKKELLN